MSEDQSARLALTYLAAGQMQSHVTLNETLTRLDALVQCRVASRSQANQPTDPGDGALYILPADTSGPTWGGLSEGDLVRFEAAHWSNVEAFEGLLALIADEGCFVVRQDGQWRPLGGTLRHLQNLDVLAIGTTADATNPLSARLNNVLFTALEAASGGDGDLRFMINKETAADTASQLFQTGFTGHAEQGLMGDNQYRLKVSADGSTWQEVFSVDPATGVPAFAKGASRVATAVFTASGTYMVPAWASWLDIACVAGGGGGGAGHFAASGSARFGGGGGGAGGFNQHRYEVAGLPSTLAVTVGAGGTAGAAAGGRGGVSQVTAAGTVIMLATGGSGGALGSSGSGLFGNGGVGITSANPGGSSQIAVAGGDGETTDHPVGAGGGGAGGGLDAANTARDGGYGGFGGYVRVRATRGAFGSGAAGGAGSDAPDINLYWAGGAGGGGGANASGAGYNGGAGGKHGGGGGGGGAGLTAGGQGGAGGAGVVIITARG